MDKKYGVYLISVTLVGEGFVPMTKESLQHGLPYFDIEITQLSTGQQMTNWAAVASVSSTAVHSSAVRII